jgi:Divergent InlB B-repeat domain
MMDDFFYGEPQPQNGDTAAPSPTPAPAAATQATATTAGSQALTVNNGRASGTAPGTVVTVTANPAPAGQKFNGWTGDITILANPSEETTTAIVPSTTPATITATYVAE